MKIAIYSAKPFEINALKKANATEAHELKFISEALRENTVELANDCTGLAAFSNDDLSAKVLNLLKKAGIKYLTLRSTGYDHIDLPHAKKLGMRVAYVPEYSPYSIAEHSVMLMLALNRKVLLANKRLRQFNFELDPLIGFDMNGKTAGIIGTGKIGGIVAKILHGFGCKLLAYDIEENPKLSEKYGVKYCKLDELLNSSDIVSLHCPLNDNTRNLIDAAAFAKMKKGSMLVNTSRGAVIDTEAAIGAIDNGTLAYLGLDVYEKEKGLFFYDHSNKKINDPLFEKLLSYDQVLITGHQAFLTQTALRNIAETTLHNLSCFEEGKDCENELKE
ncbi:MAG: 2-hydroxyacid dehydrogenase [Chitinophagales bacterium]